MECQFIYKKNVNNGRIMIKILPRSCLAKLELPIVWFGGKISGHGYCEVMVKTMQNSTRIVRNEIDVATFQAIYK